MIKIHLTLFVTMLSNFLQTSHAQSVADLVEQLILDEQKLESMKTTLQEMYGGYTVLKKGYTDFRNTAKDNFELHKAFMAAQLVVSTVITGDPKVSKILDAEYYLVSRCGMGVSHWAANATFTSKELEYIASAYSALFDWCEKSMQELKLILTDGDLRMSDADRLDAISRIYSDTNDQLAVLLELNDTLLVQAGLRLKEQKDIQTLKSMYGFPN